MFKKFNNIIFDVDGTLIDSNEISLITLQKTIEIVEKRYVDIEFLKSVLGLSDFDAFNLLKIEKQEECYRFWKKLSMSLESKKNVFPGVTETLNELKRMGVTLGVVTSREESQYYSNKNIKQILNPFFKTIVTYESTKNHKPNADPILEWLKKSNANPASTIYIGDSSNDYICANNAGISFGLAGWGLHSDIKPDLVFNNPNQILELYRKEIK